MMMETSLYTRNYLYAQQMLESGKLGQIQFMRGAHYQDMEKWPDYWMGLPPMYYATHAISPLVAASGSYIEKAVCFGSGTMRKELHKNYGNPYPVESAIFSFENGLKAEVTRSLFETCHEYTEAFSLYGSKSSFEWQQLEWEEPVIYEFTGKEWEWRGLQIETKHVKPEDRKDLLPDEIAKFTVKSKLYDERNPQVTFDEGGGHGGSHPHLVHEFLCAIKEERSSKIDEKIAANITAAGICAHESAMNDGTPVKVPIYK
jgi:predicted dehydrogenase